MASPQYTTASPEEIMAPADDPVDSPASLADGGDMHTTPLTMENSLVGKLNEGRQYLNKAGEEFQKCVGRLEDTQIESIRQTHIRLTDLMREVKSAQDFPRCINPKNIHRAHRFADEARHFHKHIIILSDRSRRAMLMAGTPT